MGIKYGTVFKTKINSTCDGVLAGEDGLVTFATCTGTPPTTANIFSKGCIMIQKDASGHTTYENTGTSASPSWDLIGASIAGDIALTNGSILVGNASNVAAGVAMSGDIAITNAGVTSIANGAIVNADVSNTAAIDFSKLATLTSGNILVGSAGNAAASVAMSGDATISNTGAVTIANAAVSPAKQTTAARTRISAIPFKIVAPTGANQGPFTTPLMVCSQALNVIAVSILSNTATVGSDATNHYQFQARNITGAADLHTGPTTTQGGELSTTTAKSITLSQNQSFTANQVFGIKIDISDDGSAGPTDLSGANLLCVVEYTI